MISMKLIGMKAVQANIDMMGALQKKKLDKALNKGALMVLASAKRWCPVDTGHLRSSLSADTSEFLTKYIHDGVRYGVLCELGNSRMEAAHGKHDPQHPIYSWQALRDRGGSGQRMPFLRTAALENEAKVMAMAAAATKL